MFRLKEKIQYSSFLQRLKDCKGDVMYQTYEGDTLNLKSAISQLLFSASILHPETARKATITFTEETDYHVLAEFLEKAG